MFLLKNTEYLKVLSILGNTQVTLGGSLRRKCKGRVTCMTWLLLRSQCKPWFQIF